MDEKKSAMAHPKVVPDPEVSEKTVRRKFTAAYNSPHPQGSGELY